MAGTHRHQINCKTSVRRIERCPYVSHPRYNQKINKARVRSSASKQQTRRNKRQSLYASSCNVLCVTTLSVYIWCTAASDRLLSDIQWKKRATAVVMIRAGNDAIIRVPPLPEAEQRNVVPPGGSSFSANTRCRFHLTSTPGLWR